MAKARKRRSASNGNLRKHSTRQLAQRLLRTCVNGMLQLKQLLNPSWLHVFSTPKLACMRNRHLQHAQRNGRCVLPKLNSPVPKTNSKTIATSNGTLEAQL